MTVAVIGATGTIGPHIVRSLQARDATIRVITRDAERARTLLAGPIEIRETDITDHDSIIDAAAGASSLLLLTSHAHDMTDVQLRIIRALRRSGVGFTRTPPRFLAGGDVLVSSIQRTGELRTEAVEPGGVSS